MIVSVLLVCRRNLLEKVMDPMRRCVDQEKQKRRRVQDCRAAFSLRGAMADAVHRKRYLAEYYLPDRRSSDGFTSLGGD